MKEVELRVPENIAVYLDELARKEYWGASVDSCVLFPETFLLDEKLGELAEKTLKWAREECGLVLTVFFKTEGAWWVKGFYPRT